tara:strand:+ start:764 stop:991 length:228 start_codon:yes stop_codon:yes gene_type:complete
MNNLNAPYLYLNAIKRIVDTPTTVNEKPSKFSGGGLMGNGKGSEDPDISRKQPYYEPHLQAFLQVANMREKVKNG